MVFTKYADSVRKMFRKREVDVEIVLEIINSGGREHYERDTKSSLNPHDYLGGRSY